MIMCAKLRVVKDFFLLGYLFSGYNVRQYPGRSGFNPKSNIYIYIVRDSCLFYAYIYTYIYIVRDPCLKCVCIYIYIL